MAKTAKTAKTAKSKSKRARAKPWNKKNPKKGGKHKRLTPKAKAAAKRRATAAGRPYPSLVDNMRAAAKRK